MDVGSLLLLALAIPWILIATFAHHSWSFDYIRISPRISKNIQVQKSQASEYETSNVAPVVARAQDIRSDLENFNYTVERVLDDRIVAREEEREIVEEEVIEKRSESKIAAIKSDDEDFVIYDYNEEEIKKEINDSVQLMSSAIASTSVANTVAYQAVKAPKINWIGFSGDPTAVPENKSSIDKVVKDAAQVAEIKDGDFITGDMDLSTLKNSKEPEKSEKNKSQKKQAAESIATSEIFLTARSIDLVNGKVGEMQAFTVEFFDNGEVYQSNKKGEVLISENLSSKFGVRSALIGAKDFVPVVSDLVFEKTGVEASIPMITLDSFSTLLNQYQVNDDRGAILVEVNEDTIDLELNAEAVRVNLDADYKITEEENYSYTMFLGVSPGNIVMTYKRSDESLVSKLMFVESGRIYFEANYYVEKEDEKFEMFEKAPLAIVPTPLKVGSESITEEFTNAFPEILNFNTIKFPTSSYAIGSRRYINVQSTIDQFMVGLGESGNIILPSEVMTNLAYEALAIEDLETNCLVQVNTKKDLKEISYVGKSILKKGELDGPMYSMVVALDRDGEFYSDISEETTNFFLMGEGEGTFDVNIEYKDGSREFLKTYCKQGIHLIEQL
jgi:hypothetical protein